MTTNLSSVLILEDNPLIAMDQESMLRKFENLSVYLANSVADAEQVLGNQRVDFALLDVELQGETSEPIASRLQAADIPFAFVSGYDDAGGMSVRFGDIPALLKPLSETALRDALITFGFVV